MTDPRRFRIVFCSCPPERADELAEALVAERLAACVHVLASGHSVYRWQGEITRDREALLIIKTTADALPRLQSRLVALHPHELPEFLAVSLTEGLAGYLDWVNDNTQG